jgi:hypothetical protein
MIKIDMSDNNESLEVTFKNGVTIQIDQFSGVFARNPDSTGVVVQASSFSDGDNFNGLGSLNVKDQKFLNPHGSHGFLFTREKV